MQATEMKLFVFSVFGFGRFFLELFFPFSEATSHQRCSVRKGVLRNFAKFTGKHLCQSLFFNKVADLGTGVFQ